MSAWDWYALHHLNDAVLEVDEDKFRELVREIIRRAILARNIILHVRMIYDNPVAVGSVTRGTRWYDIEVKDGTASVYIETREFERKPWWSAKFAIQYKREGERIPYTAVVAEAFSYGDSDEEVLVSNPARIHELIYISEKIGGPEKLLELAREAERYGDRTVAATLRSLYNIVVRKRERVIEAEKRPANIGVSRDMLDTMVEEAVMLLRKAKELAMREDPESRARLEHFLHDAKVVRAGWYTVSLYEVIKYMKTGKESTIEELMGYTEKDFINAAKGVEILSEVLRE